MSETCWNRCGELYFEGQELQANGQVEAARRTKCLQGGSFFYIKKFNLVFSEGAGVRRRTGEVGVGVRGNRKFSINEVHP